MEGYKIIKEYGSILERSALFEGICLSDMEAMLGCLGAECSVFEKGELVFRRGECVPEIALLLEGTIHIQKEDYWGNMTILSEVTPGELFGEVYACLGGARIAHSAAAVKKSTVLLLDAGRVLRLCPSACPFHGKLVRNLVSVLAQKNRTLTRKIEHMSQRTTREKLLSYLSEQSLRAGNDSFDIPFNRQQLADYLAVDRSAMSSELGKMQREGILEFHRNHFVFKNPS